MKKGELMKKRRKCMTLRAFGVWHFEVNKRAVRLKLLADKTITWRERATWGDFVYLIYALGARSKA